MTRKDALSLGALAATLCVAVGGCQRDPREEAYLDRLYSQQRALEDKLNDLDYEHAIAVEELAEERGKNEELRAQLDRGPSRRTPSTGPRPSRGSDASPAPGESDETPPTLTPPNIEQGEPFDPASGRKRSRAMTTSTAGGSGLKESATAQSRETLAQSVTHIVLNPYRTQGHDFDGEPGDDGIELSLEPRDANDRFIAASGALAIVVVDPEAGQNGRVARWDFTAEQVAERLAASSEGGIDFKLPWPKEPPKRAQLRLFARFTNEKGESYKADRAIFINLPGQFSHRWTPKSSRPMQEEAIEVAERPKAPPRERDREPGENERSEVRGQRPAKPEPAADSPLAPKKDPAPADDLPPKPLARPEWKPFR